MKKIIVLFFTLFFYTFSLFGQEKEVKKPEYLFIINDQVATKEELEEYGKQGYIKSINKGVTQEVRNSLAKKFGDKVGDKEFVVLVSLLTETERIERQEKARSNKTTADTKIDDGLKVHINDSAKEFTVQMIDGENFKLSDLKGKVVLLNFWATWCAPCLKEFYEVPTKILEPFESSEFVFLPISRGESEEKVRKMMLKLKKDGIDFNAGIDPDEEIWDLYATKGIPKNFVIDQNGVIKFISTGYTEDNLDIIATEIRKLLDK